MSIRSTILGITGAFVFTAVLGSIAKADDPMPANGPAQPGSVETSIGKDFGGNGGPGQGMAIDRGGKMMPGQELPGGRAAPVDPRAAAMPGRMDPDPSRGSPFPGSPVPKDN